MLALFSIQGMEPPLQALLLMYKSFAPDLVTFSLPSNTKVRERVAKARVLCCAFLCEKNLQSMGAKFSSSLLAQEEMSGSEQTST